MPTSSPSSTVRFAAVRRRRVKVPEPPWQTYPIGRNARSSAGFRGPARILHTRFDGLVDVTHALRLTKWAGGDTTLRVFDEGDHNSILWENTDDYLSAVSDFLSAVRAKGLVSPL